ncbi:MAG: UvrD-helicase domain-containing protein [Bacillota bacterium]
MRLSEEQREAAAIGENLLVNAGAGSGKTTVLISRYIRLLEEGGLSPGQIVAITFTRKAAREMRERIDETLAALSMSDPRWEDVREQLVSGPHWHHSFLLCPGAARLSGGSRNKPWFSGAG